MYDTTQNARGICGIGDPAYIAGRWVGYRSAIGRQQLTLCVWWHARGVRHWLHERCRYEGTRRWWSHAGHHRLRPEVGSRNGGRLITPYLSVVIRNVNNALFALFVRVMGNGRRTGWCHVSWLLRWLVRHGREHVCVSFATIRPHRG